MLQITLDMRDVFIECTATDLTKAKTVLNTMCTMFSEYCSTPFEVEPVEVIDAFGQSHGEQPCTLGFSQVQCHKQSCSALILFPPAVSASIVRPVSCAHIYKVLGSKVIGCIV